MVDPSACRRDDMDGIVVLAPAAAPDHQNEIRWRCTRQRRRHVGVPVSTLCNAAVPRH
jgi:hypothetical protein